LIKEKVKEIHKVVEELDKKIQNAKMIEICAIHQKEEALTEKKELQAKIEKIQEQNALAKLEM